MHRRLIALALAGAMAASGSARTHAWSPDDYYYGTGRCESALGYSTPGGDGYSTGDPCDLQPPCVETCTVNPEEDTRVYADARHEMHVIPRERINVEHVYHHLNKIHHVIHDVNQDIYIRNVRVHHNVTHEQTVHHWRHHTNYFQQDVDENVYEHETLPTRSESDCDPWGVGE